MCTHINTFIPTIYFNQQRLLMSVNLSHPHHAGVVTPTSSIPCWHLYIYNTTHTYTTTVCSNVTNTTAINNNAPFCVAIHKQLYYYYYYNKYHHYPYHYNYNYTSTIIITVILPSLAPPSTLATYICTSNATSTINILIILPPSIS